MRRWKAVGVDGCRGGWVSVGWDGEGWGVRFLSALGSLADHLADDATVCVDMPIGLSRDGVRACDVMARQRLGRRGSSVFVPPPRIALDGMPYAELNALSKVRFGRGVSKQAYYLIPKIRELENLLRGHPSFIERWHETHPELCFAALSHGVPMSAPKSSADGAKQRMAVLQQFVPLVEVATLLEAVMNETQRRQLVQDDVIDAFVCCIVATLDADRRCFLPEGRVEYDDQNMPMRICYPCV